MMRTISRYFGVLLLLSCLIGLIVPSVGENTSLIVMLALAFIIFCTFFQINLSLSSLMTDFVLVGKFWLIRYVLIPVIAFAVFKWISDFFAMVLLLSFLLPAAVSSPAFTAIYGGKPELSLKILVYSNFLAVLTIPFLLKYLGGSSVQVKTGEMMMTLVYTIIIPFILHLPLKRIKVVNQLITQYNVIFMLIGLSIIFIVVTARNKPAIFEDPQLVLLYALEALAIYSVMYISGYYLLGAQHKDICRTTSISSGANNIGLGVTITALFFPGNMNIFFIIAQLIWVVMLIPLRKFFNK
jgi:predicted Na+-dependent transporter